MQQEYYVQNDISTAHCPDKAYFRQIVQDHLQDVKGGKSFEFTDAKGITWTATDIDVFCLEALDNLSEARLLYFTGKNDNSDLYDTSRFLAQFYSGDRGDKILNISFRDIGKPDRDAKHYRDWYEEAMEKLRILREGKEDREGKEGSDLN